MTKTSTSVSLVSQSPVGSSEGIYLFRCQYLARDLVSFIVAKLTEQEPAASQFLYSICFF